MMITNVVLAVWAYWIIGVVVGTIQLAILRPRGLRWHIVDLYMLVGIASMWPLALLCYWWNVWRSRDDGC